MIRVPSFVQTSTPYRTLLALQMSSHSAHSGYGQLVRHIDGDRVIGTVLPARKPFASRLCDAMLRRVTSSRWCSWEGTVLEFQAIRSLNDVVAQDVLIHSLWGEWGLALVSCLKNKSFHYVATFHNPPRVLEQIIRRKRILKRLDGVILVSDTQREFFLQAGVDKRRIQTLHHGVDVEYYTPDWSRTNRSLKLLAVGNYLRDFRALAVLCEALESVVGVNMTVIVANEEQSRFAGLRSTTVVSELSDEELLAHYRSADAIVMCLVDATANNAMLEAMACGCAVLAENIGGVQEYAVDCAVLVDKGDVPAMVEAVMNWRRNPLGLQALQKRARTRAMELSWSVVALRTREFYQRVIGLA